MVAVPCDRRLGASEVCFRDEPCQRRQSGAEVTLIAQWRKFASSDPDPVISFDSYPDDFYASHSEIVVFASATRVTAIGGNLDDRVKSVTFGSIDGILKPKRSLIAILRFAGEGGP